MNWPMQSGLAYGEMITEKPQQRWARDQAALAANCRFPLLDAAERPSRCWVR
jgi:hypothetical protein